MADTRKLANLGFLGFCPEFVQGTPNWDVKQKAGGGGAATTITVDTTAGVGTHDLNLAGIDDDWYNGLYAYCYSGTLAGQARKITDFAEAAGTATFTTAAFTGTPAAADRFLLLAVLPASSIKEELDPAETLERDYHRQTLDPPSSLAGLAGCKISFDTEIPGMETPSADGTAATEDRFSKLLKCLGTRTAKVGELVDGAASTTSRVDVTDAAPYAIGDHVLVEVVIGGVTYYQFRRVTATDTVAVPDSITVTPPLGAAPAAGADVILPEQWVLADTGHVSHTFLYLKDDRLIELLGCVGGLTATWTHGQAQKFSFSFEGEDFNTYDDFDVTGTLPQSTSKAVPFTSGAAYFDTTALGLNEISADMGVGIEAHNDTVEGKQMLITERKSTLTLKFRDESDTPIDTWVATKQTGRVLAYGGNAPGGLVALSANGQAESIDASDVGKLLYHDLKLNCVDDQTSTTLAHKLILCRF